MKAATSDFDGYQGQALLKNSVLSSPLGRPGFITKVHHIHAAVMVHWESSGADEGSGWYVKIIE